MNDITEWAKSKTYGEVKKEKGGEEREMEAHGVSLRLRSRQKNE